MKNKKLLSVIFAFTIVAAGIFLLLTKANAASESDLTFKLNSDGTSYCVSDCSSDASGALVIPSTYNGLPVTAIGDSAFFDCDSLTSITILDSVQTIGYWAFYLCDSLTSVTIGNSVKTIGDCAFYGCTSLTSITIPDSVQTIGGRAFRDCTSLTSVTIPDSVQTIGEGAFSCCDRLDSVTFGNGVKTIGEYAFHECYSLTSVTIGNSVQTIGDYAFIYCESLTSVTIPDSVQTIGEGAFYNCDSLTSITIPDGVQSIGEFAFSGCDSLTEITIPDSVETIGKGAFGGCKNLTGIWVAESNATYSSDSNGVLYNKNKTELVAVPSKKAGSYEIPDSVTAIGEAAFYDCTSLTSVTIGNSVESIGYGAFYLCESLTSVTIPDSVETIGGYAFLYCDSLTDVYYGGTKEQWEGISIDEGNEDLLDANIHFKGAAIDPLTAPEISVSGETISWAAVANADSYEVYRATSKSGKYSKVATITDLSYTDSADSKTYYYKVKAVYTADSSKNSGYSNVVSVTFKLDVPVVSVENDANGKPKLSWSKVSGAKQYTVYVATSQNGSYKKLGATKSTSYTDSKAKSGYTYFYKVIANASKSSYNSGYSNTVSCGVICGTPSLTVKIDANTGKPSLSWKKADGAVKYAIYRQLPGEETFTLMAEQTAVSYADKTAPVDTVCQYYVQALGKTAELNGNPSKVVSATSGIPKPTVTGGLNDLGQPKLSWKQVEGAVKYEVYRSTKSGSGYVLIQTVESLTCEDTTATIGKTYYYKVKAVGAVSKSADSSYVKLVGKCATPELFIETDDSARPYLKWYKVDGAKKYTVYRATSQNGKYSKLGTTTKIEYIDTKATPGSVYYYKVIANASSSKYNSGYSNIVSCGVNCATPVVKVSNNANGKTVLTWSKVTGATKYEIYLLGAEDYVTLATVTGTTWTDADGVVGDGRYYGIRAIASAAEFSSEVSEAVFGKAIPATPKVSGKVGANKKPVLTWGEVEGATKYIVYRSTKKDKGYTVIGESEVLTYEDLTAAKGKTYYYKVVAVGDGVQSAQSSYAKVKSK